jgi:hypothetical protein
LTKEGLGQLTSGRLIFLLFSFEKDLGLEVSINSDPLIELIWNFGDRFSVLDPSKELI